MTTEDERYPLMDHAIDNLQTNNGRHLTDITMESVMAGDVGADDIRIEAGTLLGQAEIARQAGLPQLAANLARAAELTAVPRETLLAMYELLRPGRATVAELIALATALDEEFNAPENAKLVREAAQVYQDRGLLRRTFAS